MLGNSAKNINIIFITIICILLNYLFSERESDNRKYIGVSGTLVSQDNIYNIL